VPSASASALAKIQARETASQREESESDESELEVFDENSQVKAVEEGESKAKGKGKGKEKEIGEGPIGKKRRRGIDPWTGAQILALLFCPCVNFRGEGYDETKTDVYPLAATDTLPDKQQLKRARTVNSPSSDTDSDTPQVEMDVTQKPTSRGKKKKNKATEIIDVDALSESSGG
jgi:hypothetical protein